MRFNLIFTKKLLESEKYRIAKFITTPVIQIIISVLVISSAIVFYFDTILGISVFNTELLIFNIIFGVASLLYLLFFMSTHYLHVTNQMILEQEISIKRKKQIEFNLYKNQINQTFLYNSLESLISISKKDIEQAEQFLDTFAGVYRNILTSKANQLNCLLDEINATREFIIILNHKYHDSIKLKISVKEKLIDILIVPGCLLKLVENAVKFNITHTDDRLEISIEKENDTLKISNKQNLRLRPIDMRHTQFREIQEIYKLTYNKNISRRVKDDVYIVNLPLLKRNKVNQK